MLSLTPYLQAPRTQIQIAFEAWPLLWEIVPLVLDMLVLCDLQILDPHLIQAQKMALKSIKTNNQKKTNSQL